MRAHLVPNIFLCLLCHYELGQVHLEKQSPYLCTLSTVIELCLGPSRKLKLLFVMWRLPVCK